MRERERERKRERSIHEDEEVVERKRYDWEKESLDWLLINHHDAEVMSSTINYPVVHCGVHWIVLGREWKLELNCVNFLLVFCFFFFNDAKSHLHVYSCIYVVICNWQYHCTENAPFFQYISDSEDGWIGLHPCVSKSNQYYCWWIWTCCQ